MPLVLKQTCFTWSYKCLATTAAVVIVGVHVVIAVVVVVGIVDIATVALALIVTARVISIYGSSSCRCVHVKLLAARQ